MLTYKEGTPRHLLLCAGSLSMRCMTSWLNSISCHAQRSALLIQWAPKRSFEIDEKVKRTWMNERSPFTMFSVPGPEALTFVPFPRK